MRQLFQVLHLEKATHSNDSLCGYDGLPDDRVTADRSAVTCQRCIRKLAKEKPPEPPDVRYYTDIPSG